MLLASGRLPMMWCSMAFMQPVGASCCYSAACLPCSPCSQPGTPLSSTQELLGVGWGVLAGLIVVLSRGLAQVRSSVCLVLVGGYNAGDSTWPSLRFRCL